MKIRTQDNRSLWRLHYVSHLPWIVYPERRPRIRLERWRPSFWWRITHTARGILRRA